MSDVEEYQKVPVSLIQEPSDPARRAAADTGINELAESIRARGVLQPLAVFPSGSGYEVAYGHRRLLAARLVGLAVVPCRVLVGRPSALREEQAAENLERRDFLFSEEAAMVRSLFDSMDQDLDRVARALNRGRGWVDDRLLSALWPDEIRIAVDGGALGIGAARELMRITVPEDQRFYAAHAIASGASNGLVRAWRQAWELSRVCSDPAAMGNNLQGDGHLPRPPELPCFWCYGSVPCAQVVHLRFCPLCANQIAVARGSAIGSAGEVGGN